MRRDEPPATDAQAPRLWSRGFRDRVPIDSIPPGHAAIHRSLSQWGAWARRKAHRNGLGSVESLYRRMASRAASTAPKGMVLQEIISTERAVNCLPRAHRKTIIATYVWNMSPTSICSLLHLRYEAWPQWIFAARSVVANLLRRGMNGSHAHALYPSGGNATFGISLAEDRARPNAHSAALEISFEKFPDDENA